MEKPLKVKLHILSPVHIGCDDVYEPTSFVIDEKRGKLIEFDQLNFIKSLSQEDRRRLTAICMQGTVSSIVSIYKFIAGRPVTGREVEIATGLLSHYKRVKELSTYDEKKIKQELNQFAISRTAYNPHNNLPYIPGSSLKGSLRTAYLSKLAKDKGVTKYKGKAKDLEIELLGGSFATDPFRMVKISDFLPIGDVKTKIVYVVNKKKKTSKFEARGPFQILETVKDVATFEGIINIQQPEQLAGIKKPIAAKDLLKAINDFYISAVNEENKVTKEINAASIVTNRINEKFKDKIGKTVFLLRIGRHSGAEAVTIEGNRYIKIMQAKGQQPKFLDYATTIWLASETSKPNTNNGLLPLGWAVMEVE
ncbi:MAG: type III-A CRISPR-associated RAMP protein Csm5 [Nitrospirae bacterium]|nr:type III-A CRISPR-associated RAMP protein Csm5 [Nitrospirota bacterium]